MGLRLARGGSVRLIGQPHGEAGPPAGGALDLEGCLQFMGRLADHGQAEAGGGEIVTDGFLGAVVVFEDARQFIRGDADAVIAYDDLRGGRGYWPAGHLNDLMLGGVADPVDHPGVEQNGLLGGNAPEHEIGSAHV